MRPVVTLTGAVLGAIGLSTIGLAGAAYAEPPTSSDNATTNDAGTQNGSSVGVDKNIEARFVRDLRQDGFSDIQVMPQSYLVRAKDKQGRPVMMVINPDSFTAVIGPPPANNGSNSGQGADQSSPGTAGTNQSDQQQ